MSSKRSNGEGTVWYDETRKRWQGRLGYTDTQGVFRRRSVYGASRAECVEALGALRDQVAAGVTPANRTGGVSVAAFIETWITEIAALEVIENRRAQSTVNTYATHLRRYVVPVIGPVALARVTTADVRQVMLELAKYRKPNGQPLGTSARRQTLLGMRVVFDAAITDHLMSANPAHAVPLAAPAHVKGRPHALDQAAIVHLATTLTGFDRALIFTYLGTGARRHEIVDLGWEDIDWDARTLTIGKSKTAAGTGRVIDLSPQLWAELDTWRRARPARQLAARRWVDSGRVFTNSDGGPLDLRWVTRHVTDVLSAAGTPGHPHTLRHTFITRALMGTPEHSANAAAIAAIVGHADASYMIATYAQSSSEDQRRAVDAVGQLLS